MNYNINVDSFKLWREQNGYDKPFSEWGEYKQSRFNKWCLEHKKHDRVAKLFKNSQYKNDEVPPERAREFAEAIIKHIDEEKPLAVAMYEYEGGIYLETARIGILEERVEEYVHRLYDDYFEKRFNDAKRYIQMNNDKRHTSIFDINTGNIIGTK